MVGPNGAGKSTLLKGIVGALKPVEGAIRLSGDARAVAYLPQAAEIDRSFPLPVYDLVAMGLWARTGAFGGVGPADKARIEAALAAVGLAGFERRSIGTLSGGQAQRALFARLLVQDAPVILLDEPFTALDAKTTADLLDLVRRWHREARTVVAVLHDLDTVRRVFPDTLLIAREPVAWGETEAVLSAANLLKARRMIEAFDPQAHLCERGRREGVCSPSPGGRGAGVRGRTPEQAFPMSPRRRSGHSGEVGPLTPSLSLRERGREGG